MKKLIEGRLLPSLSFILGVAICTSTSILSISYTLIAIVVLFRAEFFKHFKTTISNSYVVSGLLFYLVFLLAVLWTKAPIHDTWKMLVRIIEYLLLPLFYMAFQTNSSAKLLLRGFLIGAILSAMLSILSFLFKHHILYGTTDNMWVVFHGHILHNAFLAIASSFFLRDILDKEVTSKQKIFVIFCYLICFIDVIFIVNGRTGQLMLLAMSIFTIIYQLRFKGIIFLFLLSVIIGPLLYFSPIVRKGIADYNSDTKKYEQGNSVTSVGLRYEFHEKSKELIKQSPIIGYGTGSFRSVYQTYTNFTGVRATTNPHCDWLWIGVETGILGITIFSLFLLCTLLKIRDLIASHRCIGLTLILGYLLSSLQNSFFIDNVTGMAFIFIITAILIAGKKPS